MASSSETLGLDRAHRLLAKHTGATIVVFTNGWRPISGVLIESVFTEQKDGDAELAITLDPTFGARFNTKIKSKVLRLRGDRFFWPACPVHLIPVAGRARSFMIHRNLDD